MIRRLALAFLLLAAPAAAQVFDTSGREKVNVETGAVTCSQSTASNLKVDLSGTGANATAVKVDGSAATQPVSGSVTCNAGTNLNTSALATSAKQDTIIGHVDGIEASLSAIAGTVAGSELQVDVITMPTTTVTGSVSVTGSVTASDPTFTDAAGTTVPANAAFVAGTDGTNTRALKTDSGGELQVDVLTVPTVTVTDGSGPMTVDGTVSVSGSVTVTDGSGALNVIVDSSALPSGASTAAKQPALGTAGSASADVITIQGVASMTPVVVGDGSGALNTIVDSSALPTGASTLAEQQSQTTSLQLLDDSVSTTGSAVPAKGVQATGTDGTNARALKTDSSGELQVDVLTMPTVTVSDGGGSLTVDGSISCSNCSGSGASAVDDAAFAVATDSVAPAGYLVDETATDSADEGDVGLARMSANRVPYAQLRDAAGNERGANVTAANALKVDGSGVTQPVSGTITANLSATDNAVLDDIADGIAVTATDLDVRDLTAASDSVKIGDGTDTALVSGSGSLQVTCDNCGGSTFADDDAFTGGSSTVLPIGALYDTSPPAISDGSAGIPRMNSSRALLVDGSAVTQPVSGTVTANLSATDNAVLDDIADGITVTGPLTDTELRATPVPVSGTVTVTDGAGALNVIVDSGSITANAGTNLNTSALALESGGNLATVSALSKAEDAQHSTGHTGVMALAVREATATDLSAGASDGDYEPLQVDANGKLHVNPGTVTVTASNLDVQIGGSDSLTIGTFPDNEPFNVAQINGVAPTMGNGVSGTGVQRVTIASDSTGTIIATQATASSLNTRPDTSGATASAPPARADFVGGIVSGATGGLLGGITVCDSSVAINVSTATTTLLITGSAGQHWRICSINLVTAAANNVALITGTGATCGTSTAGVNGGTTAASGWNFAANGGLTQGSGLGEIMSSKVSGGATGDSLCIVTSASTQLSGNISYALY